MRQTSWFRWRRLLTAALVVTAAAGFFALDPLSAQTKKAPAKAQKKEAKEPAKEAAKDDEAKAEEPKKTARPKVRPSKPAVNDVMVPGAPGVEQVALINEMLAKQWEENKLVPSDRCSDYEFVRRASLDIIGRIAKVHEIERFLKDPPRERRSRLIERLLGNDGTDKERELYAGEYAANWSNTWTVMLLTRRGVPKVYQQQLGAWLEEKLVEKREGTQVTYTPDWSKIVAELLTAKGRTNENGAVNFILAHMGDRLPPEQADGGAFDFVPLTSRTTRLFLGLRTQCVQCHDHPFNSEWGQHHFWGVNAFFRQTTAPNGRPTMMAKGQKGLKNQQFGLEDNPNLNPKGVVSYERRNGVVLFTDPTFLDGTKMELKAGANRRQELAKFVTTSPYFAKAQVNRMWGHFFGKSFTKDAVDDFGEHNPASVPELLDRLAEDWAKKYNHDPKMLIRWVCNSRAYGLSSVANETNDQPDVETQFSRMLMKAMSPEQLFESLMIATSAKAGQSKESRQGLREEWLNRLVQNFGDDEGNETTFNGTVVQALMLMNGRDINEAIMDQKEGTVAAVLKKRAFSPKAAHEAMKDLYLAALNRPPSAEEYTRILNPKVYSLPLSRARDAQTFWTGFYQDLFWALLNSSEFYLNH